jgi:hypothetical protein
MCKGASEAMGGGSDGDSDSGNPAGFKASSAIKVDVVDHFHPDYKIFVHI